MRTKISLGVLLSIGGAALLLANPASSADRLWIRIGMSGAAGAAVLEGRCPSLWQPAPYITCIDGQFVITATSSDKDRIYYIQRLEPTALAPADYAMQTAQELGFPGDGEECQRHNNAAFCWESEDGTRLFTGMRFDEQRLATQLVNEAIKSEDNSAP